MTKDEESKLREIASNLPKTKGVNHYRRMKNKFTILGYPGVWDYVKPLLDTRKKELNETKTNRPIPRIVRG